MLGLILAGFAFLLVTSPSADADPKGARWYSVLLEKGETSTGYRWAVGAKGPKHESLREVCALVSMVEPPQPEKGYVEGQDGALCGSLRTPAESMMEVASFGSGDSRVSALVVIYRPIVRRIVIVLDSGERRMYRPEIPSIANPEERGIPVFRFIADTFEGEMCASRVTTFDGKGGVISNEVKRDCPRGEPLLPI